MTTAAAGYSSYGNQIGLATGQVDEIYHPGYVAKRMEIGAVVGATPASHVRREEPQPGDVIILLGGRTGRDGIGGATGSSKAHKLTIQCVGEVIVEADRNVSVQSAERVNIFGTQHVDIQSEGGSDTRIGVAGNAEVRSQGFAQVVADGPLLIKSDTALTLKGPNSRIDL